MPKKLPKEPKILLLAGRGSLGKSSTGNSIVGKPVFKVDAGLDQTSYEILAHQTDDMIVIDGSGIGEIIDDLKISRESLVENIESYFSEYNVWFTALILVYKYGTRYTAQEQKAVEMLKSLFGQDVLKKWGVVLFTNGDQFEEPSTFHEWCGQQEGRIVDLMNECGHRFVLFDNKTQEADLKKEQLDKLMEEVGKISSPGYTMKNYKKKTTSCRRICIYSVVAVCLIVFIVVVVLVIWL
ncbi:uncharacterized protein LOC131938151 [Physella acuta]|uniref:uncharacterized protein LOC131938151 n=1 Tax=Physella acuta TaxID=109671 RepID=UPI0027DC083C|nr:uncharacterized protein LOC131938151 [Physella acuta]